MLNTGWLLIFTIGFATAVAQNKDHVDWQFSSVKQSGSEWKLVFTATIDSGWHLYSQTLTEDGPMPTTFAFKEARGYRLSGKTTAVGDLRKVYDSTFMMNVEWYERKVVFGQKVKVTMNAKVAGEIDYQVCSEEVCIPGKARFNIEVGN